jgi:hypothetical protein
MKNTVLMILVAATVGCAAVAARAAAFFNPPEVNHPNWVTDSPYQRNIFVGFDTDPETWADHPTSPTLGKRKALKSEADYAGTDDALLWDSDWLSGGVTDNGYIDWISVDPVSGRQGLLKLAVDADDVGSTLNLVWHIDNWDRSGEKHFFVEAEYYTTGNKGLDLLLPPNILDGSILLEPHVQDLGDGWHRWWAQGTLKPNPIWEEMHNTIQFEASSTDSYMLIDYMHIATECVVPEPATFVMWLTGLAMLGVCRRRTV